ncbi:hypothetical protein BKA64DRAFT_355866 [Cadophora sp. MPI-SDFR-AT-0126]|nr:hypothetical protein BKA64DRAFT_355866 [Leotiomycetes sp. MPI-SDFR-AT-0126]
MARRIWHLPSSPNPLQNTAESPTSSSPPNSNTTRPNTTSLTPPLRLHLRTLIPSSSPLPSNFTPSPISPISSTSQTPPPPPPTPWIWKCHLCNSIYRLGVTRRCLEDGHFFCAVVSPPPSPTMPNPEIIGEEEGGREKGKEGMRKAKRKRDRRRKKRRAANRGCTAHFDYGGWSTWNGWRREVWGMRMGGVEEDRSESMSVSGSEGETGMGRRVWSPEVYLENQDGDLAHVDLRAEDEDREDIQTEETNRGRSRNKRKCQNLPGDNGQGSRKNCWLDCDFPSQCHHERKAAREWEDRIREMRRLDEEWREREKDLGIALEEEVDASTSASSSWEESVNVDVHLKTEFDEYEDGKRKGSSDTIGEFEDENEVFMAGVGEWDEDEDGDTVMSDADMDFESEEDASAWAGFDPVSGGQLGPYRRTHSVRRKSIEGLVGESPPSSPLKECSFGFEDLVGGNLGVRRRDSSSILGL